MYNISCDDLSAPLTIREQDVLRLLLSGLSNQDIAAELFLSVGTIKWYIRQIYIKLNVHNRLQAIERAQQLRLFARMNPHSETGSDLETLLVETVKHLLTTHFVADEAAVRYSSANTLVQTTLEAVPVPTIVFTATIQVRISSAS